MPAPGLANAIRAGNANNVGPLGSPEAPRDYARERHPESGAMHAVETLADLSGEQLFTASFAAGAAGWLFRNTLGRINKNWGANVGRVTVAPFHALDSTSFSQLWNNPKALKANYFAEAAKYAKDHGGKSAAALAAKAEALGGAQIAKAEWKGIAKLGSYLMHRPVFSTLMAGGLAVGAGITALRSGKHAVDGFEDLNEVCKDLTGQKMTWGQFLNRPNELPPIVQDMRNNLLGHLKADAGGAVGNMVGKAAFAAMGGPMQHAGGSMFGAPMMGMMGGMMVENTAHSLAPSHSFVNSYLEIKDMQAQGQPVPAEMYAELMAASSKEVRRAGGATTEQVQRVAEQYAAEGMSAAGLVKEVFAHKPFVARCKGIAEQMEAEQTNDAGEEQSTPPEADVELPSANHVNAAPATANIEAAKHDGKVLERHKQVGV